MARIDERYRAWVINQARKRTAVDVGSVTLGADLAGDMRDAELGFAAAARGEIVRLAGGSAGSFNVACDALQDASGVAASHWRGVLMGNASDVMWWALLALRFVDYRGALVAEPSNPTRAPDLQRAASRVARDRVREIRADATRSMMSAAHGVNPGRAHRSRRRRTPA